MKIQVTMTWTIEEPDEHGVEAEVTCSRVHRRLTRYVTDDIRNLMSVTVYKPRLRSVEVKPA